jgi:hypothetical protein
VTIANIKVILKLDVKPLVLGAVLQTKPFSSRDFEGDL